MESQAQGLANAFPKDKALLNLLGSVFNQLNQAQAAITLLSGALRLDRFFIDAQFNLGIAHQKKLGSGKRDCLLSKRYRACAK